MSTPDGRHQYNEEEITTALMAVIAWAGNCNAAATALKAEGKLDISTGTLSNWVKNKHADQYAGLREKYSEKLEADLAHEFRDTARRAVEVQRLGLDKAFERLEQNKDQDPAKTAAAAATVADKMTAKLLSLTGRPTQIREDRNLEQILRSLAAKGVIQVPDQPIEITEGAVVEDSETGGDVDRC